MQSYEKLHNKHGPLNESFKIANQEHLKWKDLSYANEKKKTN